MKSTKLLSMLAFFWTASVFAAVVTIEGEITDVNLKTQTVTIKTVDGEIKEIKIGEKTAITINGEKGEAGDLKKDMRVACGVSEDSTKSAYSIFVKNKMDGSSNNDKAQEAPKNSKNSKNKKK